jgi:hypothetical protein
MIDVTLGENMGGRVAIVRLIFFPSDCKTFLDDVCIDLRLLNG